MEFDGGLLPLTRGQLDIWLAQETGVLNRCGAGGRDCHGPMRGHIWATNSPELQITSVNNGDVFPQLE